MEFLEQLKMEFVLQQLYREDRLDLTDKKNKYANIITIAKRL